LCIRLTRRGVNPARRHASRNCAHPHVLAAAGQPSLVGEGFQRHPGTIRERMVSRRRDKNRLHGQHRLGEIGRQRQFVAWIVHSEPELQASGREQF
jgi:hypothetical protein